MNKNLYLIRCDSLTQMLDVIESLLHKGIGFTADAETLMINLSGAF
jgi:hypothetical protein